MFQINAESPKPYFGSNHYDTVNFYSLFRHLTNTEDADFISRQGLAFKDYVGQYLTGNELLYYPALATKLRELPFYPLFSQRYPIDDNICGMPFIHYFYQRIVECHEAFQQQLNALSEQVNQLIEKYGQRQKPIVTAIEDEAYYHSKRLVINGVTWQVNYSSYHPPKITDCIDLYRLLGVSRDYHMFRFEDAVIGTSLIALRLGKTYQHKGKLVWYDLDTLRQVPLKEIHQLTSR